MYELFPLQQSQAELMKCSPIAEISKLLLMISFMLEKKRASTTWTSANKGASDLLSITHWYYLSNMVEYYRSAKYPHSKKKFEEKCILNIITKFWTIHLAYFKPFAMENWEWKGPGKVCTLPNKQFR